MALNDLALRLLIKAQDMTAPAVASTRAGINSISVVANQAYSAVKNFLTLRIGAGTATELVSLADSYSELSARIKLAVTSQHEWRAAHKETLVIAQDTRSPLDAIGILYTRTSKAVKELTGNYRDSFSFTRLAAESYKISGASASETAQSLRQLAQSLASGVLRGDEFNSVMENAPRLSRALSDALHVTTGALREMAEKGKLTSDVVITALLSQKDVIESEYRQLPKTVSGVYETLKNSVLKYVGEANNAVGATKPLVTAIEFAAKNLDGLVKSAVALGGVALARTIGGWTESLRQARDKTIETAAASAKMVVAKRAEMAAQIAATKAVIADTHARLANAQAAFKIQTFSNRWRRYLNTARL
jgi:tape measure domain-containing protein